MALQDVADQAANGVVGKGSSEDDGRIARARCGNIGYWTNQRNGPCPIELQGEQRWNEECGGHDADSASEGQAHPADGAARVIPPIIDDLADALQVMGQCMQQSALLAEQQAERDQQGREMSPHLDQASSVDSGGRRVPPPAAIRVIAMEPGLREARVVQARRRQRKRRHADAGGARERDAPAGIRDHELFP
jgi:hypothetical protein